MNQRISRNRNKKNNLDFVSMATGGHVSRHTPNEVTLQVPQKVTGDIKPEVPQGTAKASPNFKPITPPTKAPSKEDEKKTIAANTEPTKENEDETKDQQ